MCVCVCILCKARGTETERDVQRNVRVQDAVRVEAREKNDGVHFCTIEIVEEPE